VGPVVGLRDVTYSPTAAVVLVASLGKVSPLAVKPWLGQVFRQWRVFVYLESLLAINLVQHAAFCVRYRRLEHPDASCYCTRAREVRWRISVELH